MEISRFDEAQNTRDAILLLKDELSKVNLSLVTFRALAVVSIVLNAVTLAFLYSATQMVIL